PHLDRRRRKGHRRQVPQGRGVRTADCLTSTGRRGTTRPRRPAFSPTMDWKSMSELAAWAEQSGTKFILALFVDLRGKPCAKLVPVEAVDMLATDGVGFAGDAVGAMGKAPKDP